MRIAVPPSLRIVAGLLLAALLSIVGYQVFRRRRFSSSRGAAEASRRSLVAQCLGSGRTAITARPNSNFAQKANLPRALYAQVSQIPAESESSTTIPNQIAVLRRDLELPAARDPETRLRILTILGMLETNYDAGMAREPGAKSRSSLSTGTITFSPRAPVGEQGIAAFLLGDMATAKKDVLRAWLVAKVADPAAQSATQACTVPGWSKCTNTKRRWDR